ncbi:helix-turn-helix domain-containing protein [Lachnoclostridium sp. An181]|uniref:helix-turn-helix domain-containing protein n=1 Tax=Lachnoclostridium sp. An181 TaxID=1965575 RepID=UPI000B39B1A6|nr:AraC family transcriptional regulator [Lachnoclostridium sp. An181]OUP49358.1 AraC family transcriptional regulator [Lachnoclostridium sp. An181]
MAYQPTFLQKEIHIEKLYTVHYFEYMKDFFFEGESHDFWEFCYIDKGEIEVQADDQRYVLKKGDCIFHKPNEFHMLKANGKIAPNLVVASFSCSSPAMNFFENKLLKLDSKERNLLGELITESRNAFSCPLNDPYLQKLTEKEEPFFACEQLIELYLEQFLINLIRRYRYCTLADAGPQKSTKIKSDSDLFNHIVAYLENNITSHVTVDEICKNNLIGRSQLQALFRSKSSLGVIEYFSNMKINVAKQLIRDSHMNFTQISEYLGYSSIHYFSRQFKKITNMTPSEYASSVKALSERSAFDTETHK